MRATFSPIENIDDISITPDDDKPKRDIHRRVQKVFDVKDAKTLKVINEKNIEKTSFFSLCFQDEFDQSFKNKISQLTIFDKRDETSGKIID